MAVERNASALRVVEARQQVYERGFSGPGVTDKRDDLAWCHVNICVDEDRLSGFVFEGHPFHAHGTLGANEFDCPGPVSYVWNLIEVLEDAFGSCEGLLQGVVDADQVLNWLVELDEVAVERHQCAYRHRVIENVVGANAKDPGSTRRGDHLDCRCRHGLHRRSGHVGVEIATVLGTEPLPLAAFLRECLGDPHARNVFREDVVYVSGLFLHAQVPVTQLVRRIMACTDKDWHGQEDEQREFPLKGEHDHAEREHVQQPDKRHDGAAVDRLLHRLDVVGDAGDYFASRVPFVEP